MNLESQLEEVVCFAALTEADISSRLTAQGEIAFFSITRIGKATA